jgi:hypothetical protein
MEKVHILPTGTTPEYLLDPAGFIKIKGRAIDESRRNSPEQINEWIDKYVLDPAETTKVTIALEFLNSFNTIILTNTLKQITRVTEKGGKLIIHWFYEEDDIDIFERGEYISSLIGVPIEFTATDKISDI